MTGRLLSLGPCRRESITIWYGLSPDLSLLDTEWGDWDGPNCNNCNFGGGVCVKRKGPYGKNSLPNSPTTLGGRVAKIRKTWKWTQTQLASRLKVSVGAVSAWECGRAKPNGISLETLAAVLNTTPEILRGDVDFTMPPPVEGVAEPGWCSYALPLPAQVGRVMLVKEGSTLGSISLRELRKLAEEGLEEGRAVWLVLGGVGPG